MTDPSQRRPAVVAMIWSGAALASLACPVANALKHPPGAEIAVSIHGDGRQLGVEVSDRGPGGADPENGTGLAGLLDRVEAIDGTLEVLSPAGIGTTLRAVLPCAS